MMEVDFLVEVVVVAMVGGIFLVVLEAAMLGLALLVVLEVAMLGWVLLVVLLLAYLDHFDLGDSLLLDVELPGMDNRCGNENLGNTNILVASLVLALLPELVLGLFWWFSPPSWLVFLLGHFPLPLHSYKAPRNLVGCWGGLPSEGWASAG